MAKSNADERIPKQVGQFTFNAQSDGNFTVSENGVVKYDLADISKKASREVALPEISHLTNGESKEKIASEYAVGEVSKLIDTKNKELENTFNSSSPNVSPKDLDNSAIPLKGQIKEIGFSFPSIVSS